MPSLNYKQNVSIIFYAVAGRKCHSFSEKYIQLNSKAVSDINDESLLVFQTNIKKFNE